MQAKSARAVSVDLHVVGIHPQSVAADAMTLRLTDGTAAGAPGSVASAAVAMRSAKTVNASCAAQVLKGRAMVGASIYKTIRRTAENVASGAATPRALTVYAEPASATGCATLDGETAMATLGMTQQTVARWISSIIRLTAADATAAATPRLRLVRCA